jgi:hypothetical protein
MPSYEKSTPIELGAAGTWMHPQARMRDNWRREMRKNLLVTAAATAVIASTAFAMAQSPPGPDGQPKGTIHSQGAQPTGASGGAMKPAHPNANPAPSGSAQMQQQPGTPEQQKSGQAPMDREHVGQDQERKDQRRVGQEPSSAQGNEQGAVDQQGAQGANAKPNGSTTEYAAQGSGSSSASVKLSEEQRTKIQRIIVQNKSVARVDNPEFSVTLGTRVPKDVHITILPEEIVSIVPEYRGFDYILVGEEILIIDPVSLEIVDIIPA